jgi:hypothetical protein
VFQGQPLDDLRVHVVEELEAVAPSFFGAVHGRIRIHDQGFAIKAMAS